MQKALRDEAWPNGIALRVRMAVHTGVAQERDRDYFGPTLVSAATYELVCDERAGGVVLEDLGLHRLKDLERPEHVYQVVTDDAGQSFPALRTLDAVPNNLPQQLTSFIGREKVLEDVRAQGTRTRLLTLTGAEGVARVGSRCKQRRKFWSATPTARGWSSLPPCPTRAWCRRRLHPRWG